MADGIMSEVTDPRLALCRYIRSPADQSELKEYEARRLAIYQRLFFNNIQNFLDEVFPLLRGYYTDDLWNQLARTFMRKHDCQTPYFREIAREFLLYLEHEHQQQDADPPFMWDLAHYEWALFALEFAPQEISEEGIDPKGSLLTERLQLSPLLCSLRYYYPVHTLTKDADDVARVEQGVYLMLNRDRAHKVRCLTGNPVTARILAHVATQHQSGEDVLRAIANELGRSDVDAVISNGIVFLEQLREADIILGTLKS